MSITVIPAEVLSLSKLQVLVVSGNDGLSIGSDISSLLSLRIFQAVGCNMTTVPDQLYQLPCLEELNLSKNQLSNVDSLVQCTQLVRCDISFNQILALPEQLDSLKNIQLLNIMHNNISLLPPTIGSLPKLTALLIQDNDLDSALV